MTDTPTRLLADTMHDLTIEALNTLSNRRRDIYQRAYGINTTGQTTKQTPAQIARELNISLATVSTSLAMARADIYEHIATRMIEQVEKRINTLYGTDNTQTTPTAAEYNTIGMTIQRRGRTHSIQQQRTDIALGPQSEHILKQQRVHTTQQWRKRQ